MMHSKKMVRLHNTFSLVKNEQYNTKLIPFSKKNCCTTKKERKNYPFIHI